MPSKLLFDPFELPMKALPLLARSVVIDHGRRIQRDQDFITQGFVDLSIRNVRGIYRADFPRSRRVKWEQDLGFQVCSNTVRRRVAVPENRWPSKF